MSHVCFAGFVSRVLAYDLVLPLLLLLVGEQDHDLAEQLHKINEQLDAVPDEVVVPTSALLDNELGIVEHEATHDEQTQVHVHLKDDPGLEEDVGESSYHKEH